MYRGERQRGILLDAGHVSEMHEHGYVAFKTIIIIMREDAAPGSPVPHIVLHQCIPC